MPGSLHSSRKCWRSRTDTLARVLRRPHSRDEFELALGEAMTPLQLGNCDLVRCAARAMAAWRRDFVARRSRAGDPYTRTRSVWRRALLRGAPGGLTRRDTAKPELLCEMCELRLAEPGV
jgi:hypothetical protein